MSRIDISHILQEWPYDPEKNVRRFISPDGSEKLQVRLPLGIEQYELDGRPDGLRPEGRESYLELFQGRLEGQDRETRCLSPGDCALLYEEGVLYYFRYLLCFQIGDYDRVIRDTRRNLCLIDLLDARAVRDEDRVRLEQYRPYILRMLASARVLQRAGGDDFESAKKILSAAIGEIDRLEEVPTPTFEFEKKRSLAILRGMVEEMRRRHVVPSEKEQLRRRLRAAVETEDYERAAKLRDRLKAMDRGRSGNERSEGGPDQPEVEKHP